ncbi:MULTISPECIES: hypothetical protein [unclassified Nitratiruptor]|uniref:hypothetical protein n=1 Tax=unclassified Nitratiruptor TaxID=2624044 RepID=UPI0019154ED6|nr:MULTISPECIES: hypothetical protein [unclassified Nitratiruptor]BCD59954.1 hypothetical protein NitYY0810_C0713 [Nitratiruptor sp. YY08-10]BCD63877.1 hypothetical protein NitYY0814_C0712 [Nitratiruptor sp. YY08-14]
MRKSFTLYELILVIVIIGILSSFIIPRLQTNPVVSLANQLIEHIRYTQHLAMADQKFDPYNPEWYKERWQIRFFKKKYASRDHQTSQFAYAIFSDHDVGSGYDGNPNATTGEVVKDPITHKLISGGFTIYYDDPKTYKKAAIGEEYGVVDVKLFGGCSGKRISFDALGRPYKGSPATMTQAYQKNRLIHSECKIKVCFDDKDACPRYFIIAIEPETGFSYIKTVVQ